MSKFFVTGGAGFIGSFTIKQLIDLGHEVALFDSFTNYIFPIDKTYIDNINYRMSMIKGMVKTYRGNTQDLDLFRRAIMEYKPDRIIHLAAMPLANLAVEHPEEPHAGRGGRQSLQA